MDLSHCTITSNGEAAKLAKESRRLSQPDINITYNDAKRLIRSIDLGGNIPLVQ